MSSWFHSIRWRVQAWHGLILLGAIIPFCLTAYHFAWDHQLRRIDRDLQGSERRLIRALLMASGAESPRRGPGPSPEELAQKLRERKITLPADIIALFESTAYYSFREADGTILLQSSNAPADLELLPLPPEGFTEDFRSIGSRRESRRASAQGFSSLVGRDITEERAEMHRLGWVLAACGGAVWLLGLGGGWWLGGRAIKPIATISRTASRIAEGNLTERIDTEGNDSELDQLSRVLNQTFDRLHAAFERQKQFTADASHELRTPVTILLSETERIMKRDRTPEEYRDVIRTCHETAERMARLIEALLMLTRQQATGAAQTRESVDLAPLLQDAVQQLQPLASTRQIRFETNLSPARCRGEALALAAVATNLIGNAIAHHHAARSAAWVQVSSGTADGKVFFRVQDNGPGIGADDLPRIFDRFYRVDKARTGSSGHTGLGLAIARTIVENHGGTIAVQSVPGEGSTFTVQLPAAS